MADNVNAIAAKLGAVVVGQVPDAGGGAFGAARLAHDVARLRAESRPVRIAGVTLEKLMRLAERASTPDRKGRSIRGRGPVARRSGRRNRGVITPAGRAPSPSCCRRG